MQQTATEIDYVLRSRAAKYITFLLPRSHGTYQGRESR